MGITQSQLYIPSVHNGVPVDCRVLEGLASVVGSSDAVVSCDVDKANKY